MLEISELKEKIDCLGHKERKENTKNYYNL